MAKNIGYLLQPNATPTAAEAPYLVRLVPTGVANDADLIAELAAEMPVTEARYAMIWREAIARAIPHLKAGESVDLGAFRLVPHITKAMAYEDSAFDPAVNELIVAVYLIGELAEATKGLVPKKLSSAAVDALVKVSNVMDVKTERFSEIRGTDEFAILGNGVTLDGEDEYVRALNAKTGETLAEATVVKVSKGQRAFATFAEPLPAGRVTIEIGTHGLIADAHLHVFTKTVSVLAAPPVPRINEVVMRGYESTPDEMPLIWTTPVTIKGTGLKLQSGDVVKTELEIEGAIVATGTLTGLVTASDDTTIEIAHLTNDNERCPDGDWWRANTRVVIEREGQRYVHPVTFTEG